MPWNRIALLLASAALVTACAPSMYATASRSGRMYPSKPAGCSVRFENLTYQEAAAKYEHVGLATLTGTADEPQAWEGVTREMLWPKVCQVGGTVVTLNGATEGQRIMGKGTGMIQFAVWHEREDAEE